MGSAADELDERHPARVMARENRVISGMVVRAQDHVRQARELPDDELDPTLLDLLKDDLAFLSKVSLHYRRKEELLVPVLADHGETSLPRRVQEDDDRVRTCLWMASSLLDGAEGRPSGSNLESAAEQLADACDAIDLVAEREDDGLIPLALEVLGDDEWALVARRSEEPAYVAGDGAPALWTSPIERAEAAVRRAIDAGRLPGASGA